MVVKLRAKGIDDCTKVLTEVSSKGAPHVYLFFVGSDDPATGQNWCPDCVKSEPVVDQASEESAPHDAIIIIRVDVGDRPTWKDPDNVFRTDSRFQLKSIPTLIQHATNERLEADHLTNLDTIKTFFEATPSASSDK